MLPQKARLAVMNQRGIALPLALIVLMLLTSLTLVFLGLSSTEPTIAANLKRGEEALALAEAGIDRGIWALSNPAVTNLTSPLPNPVPAPYGGAELVQFGGPGRAYTITVQNSPLPGAGPNARLITAHGYVVRDGVVVPALPGNLAPSNIAAHRVVQLEVTAGSGPSNTVGGPGTPNNVRLPGALTVAGTLEMSGNSLVDGNDQAAGTPNSCARKGGVTIRDKTKLPDNACQHPPCELDNTISLSGSASAVGTPAQQELGYNDFAPYAFSDAQLAALKALAQKQGTYIQPASSARLNLTVVNGLMFVDTVNGQALDTPPRAEQLANVGITGANNSGWLIVMGSIAIDGNVTYNGFIYAHNDLSYRGTGTGAIHGGVLTGNVVDSVATVVDGSTTGNAGIYYDCNAIANGGGAFTQAVQNGLNRVIVTVTRGTWREVSN